jgi:ElaB/YqjD/DUF883 family membrane-anchored ribosome-binding protein
MTRRMDGSGVGPQTIDQARDAVERSRKRLSRTLDRLEDRIVEKKQELQDRADIFRPVKKHVRERPLTTIVVAVGVGALIGSLGARHNEVWYVGGGGDVPGLTDDDRRELRDLRRRRGGLRGLARRAREGRSHSRFGSLRGQLMSVATSAITAAITNRLKEVARGSSRSGRESRHRDRAWD